MSKYLVECIMNGEGAIEVLSQEIAQDELDLMPELFDYLKSLSPYQLPPHVTPAIFPPPLQLDPHPFIPMELAQSPRSLSSPPLSPTSLERQPPTLMNWIPIFQRHSVLWKFHTDFYKIEEWAFCGQPSKNIARMIVADCKDITSFNRRLFSALFFLIKRKQDLTYFVDSLIECFTDCGVECEQYSVRFFVNLLFSNCDRLLRQKITHLLSISNPVPLTEFIVEDGDTFSQQFTAEPFALMGKFLFFSYGMDGCRGKSSIINKIFGTKFETSKNSQFFKGTVDFQSDRMIIPSRGVALADGHGLIEDEFMVGMLRIADGLIIHLHHETWSLDPAGIQEDIQKAVQHGIQFVVLLVRDVIHGDNGTPLEDFESPDNLKPLGDTGILLRNQTTNNYFTHFN